MSHTCRHGATFFILVLATGPTGGEPREPREPREPPTWPRKKRSRRGEGRLAYSLAARHVINFAFDYRSTTRRFSPLHLRKSSIPYNTYNSSHTDFFPFLDATFAADEFQHLSRRATFRVYILQIQYIWKLDSNIIARRQQFTKRESPL